jgi:ferrous iron transport protein B
MWLLLNLPFGEKNLEKTFAGKIGKTLSYIFEPIGLGDWRISTSILSGFLAREAIISNLGVIMTQEKKDTLETNQNLEDRELKAKIKELLTPKQALSFLLFVLIYNSCLATVVVMAKEGNLKFALGFWLYSFILAWLISFINFKLF